MSDDEWDPEQWDRADTAWMVAVLAIVVIWFGIIAVTFWAVTSA